MTYDEARAIGKEMIRYANEMENKAK